MRRLRQFLILLLISGITGGASAQEPQILPRKLLDDGWIELFDGTTLFGWQTVGEARWFANRGVVSTPGDKPGWLMTTAPWSDFELHAEFKAPAETNSGIFFRSALEPTDPSKDCYELNIAPQDNPFPTGSLVGRARGKAINVGDGEWHSFDVMASAGKVTVHCDGQLAVEYSQAVLESGRSGQVIRFKQEGGLEK